MGGEYTGIMQVETFFFILARDRKKTRQKKKKKRRSVPQKTELALHGAGDVMKGE